MASVINEAFVPIKVDREERPDVDKQYMQYVQMLTGHGGWPLTVFMTPEGHPFYGCTYLGKEDLIGVCERIRDLWKREGNELANAASNGWKMLQSMSADGERILSGNLKVSPTPLFEYYEDTFDDAFGGFNRHGTKFPMPVSLIFLLHYYKLTGDQTALSMALFTAQKMTLSALHDHLEGGFHRYSVDHEWSTPHFEKMLYDQALLLEAFTELFTITRDRTIYSAMDSIIRYVDSRLKSEHGTFYCAEDADSLDPVLGKKEEGAFALWTVDELKEILAEQDVSLVADTFGISPTGNAVNLPGKNCLNKLKGAVDVESKYENYSQRLEKCLDRLREARNLRPRPDRDEKILTAWNALMISALSKAGIYMEDALKSAIVAFETISSQQPLYRTSGTPACADDYAFLIKAALDLYNVTLTQRYLDKAVELQIEMDKIFALDDAYYYSQPDPDNVLLCQIDDYDGVEPSANSIAVYCLKVLNLLTENEEYKKRYDKIINRFSRQLIDSPNSLPMMMTAMFFDPVVISVPLASSSHCNLLSKYPTIEFLFKQSADSKWQICHNNTCHGPFDTITQVEEYLEKV